MKTKQQIFEAMIAGEKKDKKPIGPNSNQLKKDNFADLVEKLKLKKKQVEQQ